MKYLRDFAYNREYLDAFQLPFDHPEARRIKLTITDDETTGQAYLMIGDGLFIKLLSLEGGSISFYEPPLRL